MTCIVGVVQDGCVYIGGDSAGVAGSHITIRKDPKVFYVDSFLIGCCGSFRMAQLLQHSFRPPKIDSTDLFRYMCTNFIDSVRSCFKKGGYLEKKDEVEQHEGEFLVAHQDRLFCVETDYQVGETAWGYAACGTGEQYALGSLHMTEGSTNAIQRVYGALETAAKFTTSVEGPFVVLKTQE